MSEEQKNLVLVLPVLSVPVGKEYNREYYPEGTGVYFVRQENKAIYLAEVNKENESIGVFGLPVSVLYHLWEKNYEEKQQHIVEVLMDKMYDRLNEMTVNVVSNMIKKQEDSTQRLAEMIHPFTDADRECWYKIAAGFDAIQKEIASLSKVSGVSEATLLDIIRTVTK